VDIGIGATLREARNRRKIDLSQVEEATRIRARYLRAIESEDWDVLPGDVYARSFIRTYATYLGLDGERLAEEFRRATRSEEKPAANVVVAGSGGPRSPTGGRAMTIAVVAALVGAVVAIGLATSDEDSTVTVGGERTGKTPTDNAVSLPSDETRRPGLSIELTATAEVWVCLLDAGGRPLVNGQILSPGAEEGPFRSGSFTVSFGNGEVSMTIDGKEAEIPATSSPVGYSIDRDGVPEPLAEGERPDCL
jgi:Helix-turn-helix domain